MFFSSTFRCTRNYTLTKLSRRLLATFSCSPTQQQQLQLQQHQHQQSLRKYAKETKGAETFNTPRPPKDPPDDYKPTCFNHKAFDPPDCLPCAIFRQFSSPDEKLGPSAAKDANYKNPEYYAYHRFTFVEMQLNVLEIRRQAICNDNAKCIYDYESDDEADKCKAADSSADKDGKKKAADSSAGKDGKKKAADSSADKDGKKKAADSSADKDGKKKASADGEKAKSCGNKNENKAKNDKAPPNAGAKK